MNYKYNCLNPIADCGLANLGENYARTEKFEEADAVFVRSAKMDEFVPGPKLLAVARAGAGVNTIPHAEYAKKGIVVFNTPGANANGVKGTVVLQPGWKVIFFRTDGETLEDILLPDGRIARVELDKPASMTIGGEDVSSIFDNIMVWD